MSLIHRTPRFTESTEENFDYSKFTQRFTETNREREEFENQLVEKYLEDLWDTRTVKYFTCPDFRKSDSLSEYDLKSGGTQRLFVGGYPSGMLRGLRVEFRANLKPWLKRPRRLHTSSNTRESIPRKSSNILTASRYSVNFQDRNTGVQKLLDILMWHTGGRTGAQVLWDFLRRKSNQLLASMEGQMDKEFGQTFAVYSKECVLAGEKEPPMCSFMREDPTISIVNTLKSLKAPGLKRKLCNLRSIVRQSNQSQDKLKMNTYRPEVEHFFTEKEIASLFKTRSRRKDPPRKMLSINTRVHGDRVADTVNSYSSVTPLKPLSISSRQAKRQSLSQMQAISTLQEKAVQLDPLCWTQLYEQHKLSSNSTPPNSALSTKTETGKILWGSSREGTLLKAHGRVWKPEESYPK